MKRRHSKATGFWLLLSLFLLIQVNTTLYRAKIDLTEQRVHTLSEATRSVLASLNEPLSLRYYVSARLQREFSEPQRIEDLVLSYANARPSIVQARVERVDVERVERDGIPIASQPLARADENSQSVSTVFSGIVVEYLDEVKSIPFVFDSRDLEYRLTTAIRSLARVTLPVASVISSDPDGLFAAAQLFQRELEPLFSLSSVRTGEEIPPNSSVLIVDAGGPLGGDSLQEVERFLDGGGNVLLLAQPVSVRTDGSLFARESDLTGLNTLLATVGLQLGEELLLDEPANSLPVQEIGPTGPQNRLIEYPLWPRMIERNTLEAHPLTTRFSGLDLYWAGVIRLLRGHPARPEALVASSSDAWLMSRPYDLLPSSPRLERESSMVTAQYVTVAQAAHASGGTVILISDADFVRDVTVDSTASYQNIEFAVQTVQYLANESELLALRSRSVRDLSLSAIDEPGARAALERFAQLASMVAVPATVLVIGAAVTVHRRRRSQRHLS